MRYEFSPLWHRLGKLGMWRMYENTLPYHVNRRYLRFGRTQCKGIRSWPLRAEDPIIVPGAMAGVLAARCSDAISRSLAAGMQQRSSNVPFLVEVKCPLDLFGGDVLDIFDGPLGDNLRKLYGSEFRIEWLDCYRTYAGERQASWLWHIDNVPPYLLKILVYLTDSDAETGVTEFLPAADTRHFKSAGYFGVTRDERRTDLAELARQRNIPYRPISLSMNRGDAIIFNTNCLHRGGAVRHGFRDVMSFLFLPSRFSWRRHFEQSGPAKVQVAGGFPRDPFAAALSHAPSTLPL
jgi:hypothetical protein